MSGIMQDFRFALRSLRERPRVFITAVVTLAIAMGATTAIFTVIKAVVFEPLPYPGGGQLVKLNFDNRDGKTDSDYFTRPDFTDIGERAGCFSHLAAYHDYRQEGLDLTGGDQPRRVIAMRISRDYIAALGHRPLLGRTFTAADEDPQVQNVIISYRLWQEHFNGDRSVIGSRIMLDREPRTVVGVLPPAFAEPYARSIDVWTPEDMVSERSRGNYYLSLLGRLRPGISLEAAQTELNTIVEAIDQDYPNRDPWQVRIEPLKKAVIGSSDTLLLIVFAAVAVVLLIACVNVANLSLAHGIFRERELAIRTMLGSNRTRIVRQLLCESIVMALAGGGGGLLLAYWVLDLLVALRPDALPRVETVALDPWVFGFTALVSLLTGVLSGLVPALRLSRPDVERLLRETGRTTSSGLRHRGFRNALVVSQVSLAFILLVCATLLVRSFGNLLQVDPGFDQKSALTFEVNLPTAAYSVEEPARRIAFNQQFIERLEALPGVRAAGAISRLPLTGQYHSWTFLLKDESEAAGEKIWHLANIRIVAGDYFPALGVDLIRGRPFDSRDTLDSPGAAIVNRALVERHFPDSDAIGQTIYLSGQRQIIGVVDDVRTGLREEIPNRIYIAYDQFANDRRWGMTYLVAGNEGVTGLAGAIRKELHGLDPELVMHNPNPLGDVVGKALASSRFAMGLMVAFAVTALVLALIGIHGVLSYTVGQRYHEIGVRIALGASGLDISWAVVRESLSLTAIAIGIGIGGATLFTRGLQSLVFGISPNDPTTLGLVAAVVVVVGFAASLIPAGKAAKADPAVMLRGD